jgi:hypothetical protein
MLLPAEAFSVKPGGVVDRLEVGGDLVTHGAKVTTYAVLAHSGIAPHDVCFRARPAAQCRSVSVSTDLLGRTCLCRQLIIGIVKAEWCPRRAQPTMQR